jgi:hypothetical protein
MSAKTDAPPKDVDMADAEVSCQFSDAHHSDAGATPVNSTRFMTVSNTFPAVSILYSQQSQRQMLLVLKSRNGMLSPCGLGISVLIR